MERYVSGLALHRVSALYEMWSVFAISRMAVEFIFKRLLDMGHMTRV